MDNEQMKLYDDTEAVEQEITQVVEKEYERTKDIGETHYIRTIKNRHEGYGHAAEGFIAIEVGTKKIKDDLKEFLGKLIEPDDIIVRDVAGDIYNHAEKLAASAVLLAATAKRIVYDILMTEGEDADDFPLEALINDATEADPKAADSDIDYDDAEIQ